MAKAYHIIWHKVVIFVGCIYTQWHILHSSKSHLTCIKVIQNRQIIMSKQCNLYK
jgi:hypothetical protein